MKTTEQLSTCYEEEITVVFLKLNLTAENWTTKRTVKTQGDLERHCLS